MCVCLVRSCGEVGGNCGASDQCNSIAYRFLLQLHRDNYERRREHREGREEKIYNRSKTRTI